MKRALPAVIVSLFALSTPAHAAAPAAGAQDPDLGNARAYFKGIDLKPATFERTDAKPKDIIWIVMDALRPDHLGLYGYAKPTSPFLDELSKESFVFLHAYANAPWTRPSTASMLTGLYPSGHRTQTDKSRLPEGIQTVGDDLKRLGYDTAAFVANGNGSSVAGLDRGFDHYADPASHFERLPSAAQVYDSALAFLKARKSKKPLFLFLFVVDPHDPYHAPPEYEKEWLGKFEGKPRRTAHWEYKNNYPKAERDSMLAIYDASIRYTDDQTRRFFGELGKLGLRDEATFVINADHGEGFGDHGYYLHAYHHFDEFVRVPLIVKTPAWKGAGHVFHLAQTVDILPTLVSLAGGKPRAKLPGRDLGELLAKPVDLERKVLSEYNAFGIRRSSVADLRHRVILQLPADKEVFLSRIPRTELLPSVDFEKEVVQVFDRVKDPREKRSLAPKKVPEAAGRMVEMLRQYMQSAEASHEQAGAVVPAGIQENLKSLGYVQ